MRIPKYWAREKVGGEDRRGYPVRFWAWGWSNESLAAARELAAKRARAALERLLRKEKVGEYDYLELPLREEVSEWVEWGGQEVGAVTRNRYGALVLNAGRVCFVDVDYPEMQVRGLGDALGLLFSRRRREERREQGRRETMARVRGWVERNAGRSYRLYRTAAGLRVVLTDKLYEPGSAEVEGVLEELGSDAMYRRLTRKQETFRARLTPKPWRVGVARPPHRWPFEDEQAESEYRQWLEGYERASAGHGVCELVEATEALVDGEVGAVMGVHDRFVLNGGELA